MGTFFVENFGCRATQADGAAIERQLLEKGLQRATSATEASVVVLNTCTVTAEADKDARAAIRRAHRANPEAQILVTGCYAQRAPEEIAAIPGVSVVVGNSHKHQIAELVSSGQGFVPLAALSDCHPDRSEGPLPAPELFVSDIFAHTELLAAPVFEGNIASGRTRPNLKVQDGCDNRCSFCVIPYVRGQSRSLMLERVLAEMNALVTMGYREVVLSGINLGRWGRDLSPESRFEELICALLKRAGVERLRISSVEPMDWSDELIALLASEPRIARHAHLPLQSASDAVLRRMHRKYRPWHYEEKISRIRAAMPDAAIGADVMVGFPGETDAEFRQTYDFIERLPFTYLHVFTYSARPGTPAAEMPDQVPVHVKRERNRALRELGARKNRDFRQQFVGGELSAMTLTERGTDEQGPYTAALTTNFLKLRLRGEHAANQIVETLIVANDADFVTGIL